MKIQQLCSQYSSTDLKKSPTVTRIFKFHWNKVQRNLLLEKKKKQKTRDFGGMKMFFILLKVTLTKSYIWMAFCKLDYSWRVFLTG